MFYNAYQAQADFLAPTRAYARLAHTLFDDTSFGPGGNMWLRGFAGLAELFSRAGLTHERPSYEIDFITVKGRDIPITEEIALETPFGRLLHFRKDVAIDQPRVLIVAPMAGHFATLLRHTARVMLADHDVYITDWINARDIPADAGRFGTDEYVEHLIRFLEKIGPGAHAMAVCQPCAALLTAVAVMSKHQSPASSKNHDLDGRPGRRQHQSYGSQSLRHQPFAVLVPGHSHRAGTGKPCRRRPLGLSRLRAGDGVPVDESGAPYPRPVGPVRPYPARS